MINHISNICSPILALTPFTETIVRTGEQGEIGLSGPNVQLISFNSGDDPLTFMASYVVGLGVAKFLLDNVLFSQLGVVMNQVGTLSNFEIGYSGRIFRSDEFSDRLEYTLLVIPAVNNSGNDYPLPGPIIVFSDILIFSTITSPEEISANKLIIVPSSPSNVDIGDRIVLLLDLSTDPVTPIVFESLTVQASVHFTPST